MALQLTSVAVRFWITVVILTMVLFVFEDALFEVALGADKEQGTLIGSLLVLGAFAASFLVVRRAFQIAQHRV